MPATALLVPASRPLDSRIVSPTGFVVTVAPEELSAVEAELHPSVLTAISSFKSEAGQDWRFYVDRRSGGMALVEGRGMPWIPGAGNSLDPSIVHGSGPAGSFTIGDLEGMARAFITRYEALFGVPASQLVLDERGSLNFGESKPFWNLAFHQVIDGIPVDSARVVLRLSRGNLVQFGVDRTIPASATHTAGGGTTPAGPGVAPSTDGAAAATTLLTPAQAKAALAAHVGGLLPADKIFEDGALLWVPRGTGDSPGYHGPIGSGWRAELVYRYTFERDGQTGSWQALVDARTGAVLRFVDTNAYATALVKGSVYTRTNCTDTLACVPGTETERTVTIPFAAINFVGGLCSGDACYSNSAGAFDYPSGAVASSTILDGKYFRLVDACGPVSAAAVAPNGIDLGTSLSNPPLDTNTDCQAADRVSPPGSGSASGGAGDTHSARNCFYHLNLINQKARAYLPGNDWLKGAGGASGPVITRTNLPPACNALWSSADGTLNFMKVTPPLCNNTGEIPDVFLHEFGHGLDQNDGSGTAPEGATGEAMGDTFALLQSQRSCVANGLKLPISFEPNWLNRAGYGAGSALCSGAREVDYTRFCYHTLDPGCSASQDLDAPNGSRSGLTPPAQVPDAGTPARWNHMIEGASSGADGKSFFYACAAPTPVDCVGALGHECHCESQIASQANWDFVKRLIAQRFGGEVYADPPGPREVSGWQYMDRLWYLTRDLASSAYSVTPAGATDGCGIGNWFSTYRFVDDDDGDLANGTPNADLLFSAFDLHAIACGAADDPSNTPGGCPPPVAAPVISSCASEAPVQLTWTASQGARQFRVLRNTLGCGFGFAPIATVDGAQIYYEDADVAPGVPYYYSVQPVGGSPSCYGQTSNCIAVTPAPCSPPALAAPSGVTAAIPAANQVRVSWDPVLGAGSYKIYRKNGGCGSADPFVPIAHAISPQASFVDTIDVQGTYTYSYRVAASSGGCASCVSPPSSCVSITATGSCHVPPSFAGLARIAQDAAAPCRLTLQWAAGTPACPGQISYSVYRSADPAFLPSPSNRVASGLMGTSFADQTASGGTRFYYVVRATDAEGNTENNLVRIGESAVGPLAPGTFADDAGDTPPARFTPSPTPENRWAIRSSGTGNATRLYATSASGGNYANGACMGLESETIALGASPTLSFRSRFDIDPGWDGGYVEVSTEAGGFSDWTKLTTIVYPGVIAGAGDPACGGPGFADGQPVFTGTSGDNWLPFSGSLSAYANQSVRVRFLFSSDPSNLTAHEGWFLDDIMVTDARLPGTCLGEVSPKGSGHPLRVVRRTDGNLDLIFEDLGGAASSYNVYEGTLGDWYSHMGGVCHNASTASGVPNPGDRTWSAYSTSAPRAYFYVNAANMATEGILGADSSGRVTSLPPSPCGPVP